MVFKLIEGIGVMLGRRVDVGIGVLDGVGVAVGMTGSAVMSMLRVARDECIQILLVGSTESHTPSESRPKTGSVDPFRAT